MISRAKFSYFVIFSASILGRLRIKGTATLLVVLVLLLCLHCQEMGCLCFPRRAKENFIVKFLLIVVTGIVFVSDEARPLLTLSQQAARGRLFPKLFDVRQSCEKCPSRTVRAAHCCYIVQFSHLKAVIRRALNT